MMPTARTRHPATETRSHSLRYGDETAGELLCGLDITVTVANVVTRGCASGPFDPTVAVIPESGAERVTVIGSFGLRLAVAVTSTVAGAVNVQYRS